MLKFLGIPIALITNSSLLFLESVRQDLCEADLVSLKIDAVSELTFKKVNRPYCSLKLNSILNGIVEFSKEFAGKIITETMLIKEINDSEEDIRGVASFLEGINPSEAYISIPIRPPAESRAVSPNEEVLNMAYQIFSQRIKTVKMLNNSRRR